MALETVFPGLMTPAQQLVKVHHACSIGVSKADVALELKPVVGGGHGLLRWDGTECVRFSILIKASSVCGESETSHKPKPIAQYQPNDPVGDECNADADQGFASRLEGEQSALTERDCAPQDQSSGNNWAEEMPPQ